MIDFMPPAYKKLALTQDLLPCILAEPEKSLGLTKDKSVLNAAEALFSFVQILH